MKVAIVLNSKSAKKAGKEKIKENYSQFFEKSLECATREVLE